MRHGVRDAVGMATAPAADPRHTAASIQHGRDDERAATAVEYGIMIGAIAAVIIVIVGAVGVQVDTALFDKVYDAMLTIPGGGDG